MGISNSVLPALRLELRQLSANYRLPYAYQRRLTYPLPPYSTVLGFLRNLIANHPIISPKGKASAPFTSEVSFMVEALPIDYIAVAGRFQSKTVEYTWLRTLATESEDYRRYEIYGFSQHPGKQIPVQVDTLERVELVIHLGIQDSTLREAVEKAIRDPNPYEILHMGRAEDLVILDSVRPVELKWMKVPPKHYPYSFWVPYEEAQKLKLEGLIYKIGLRAENEIITKPSTAKRSKKGSQRLVRRIMHNIPVLLWEGELPYSIETYFDAEKKIPVFLQSTDA